jgi:hypothetical protein
LLLLLLLLTLLRPSSSSSLLLLLPLLPPPLTRLPFKSFPFVLPEELLPLEFVVVPVELHDVTDDVDTDGELGLSFSAAEGSCCCIHALLISMPSSMVILVRWLFLLLLLLDTPLACWMFVSATSKC